MPDAAATERRRVEDDPAAGQLRVRLEHACPRRGQGRLVEEEVGPRRAKRQHALDRGPEGRRIRRPRPLAADHHRVVVAVQEGPFRLGQRGRGVDAEPLERAGGVPDLDDRRRGAVRGDVDRQVGVVDHEQARRLEVVHPAHQPDQVGELAGQAVAVRLEQQDVVELRVALDHRAMDVEQVAVERRDAGRRQHDALGTDLQAREEETGDPEQRAREQVFEPAHRR